MQHDILSKELLAWFRIKGTAETIDDTHSGGNSTNTIGTDQPLEVRGNFKIDGPLNYVFCGELHMELYLKKRDTERIQSPACENEVIATDRGSTHAITHSKKRGGEPSRSPVCDNESCVM